MKVIKGAMVKLKENLTNGLYVLDGSTVTGTVAVTTQKGMLNVKLWHMRLGHVSEKGLIELDK